jgi:hypothetical protein
LRKTSNFLNTTNISANKNLCIESFRQEVLPSELRSDVSDEFIRYMLKHGRCILLFDGLDEVANENEFKLVVNEINGLVSQYPKNKYLITSRYTGWRGGVGSSFLETEVNDLTKNQIQTFAHNWYKAIEYNRIKLTSSKDKGEEKTYREQRAEIKANQLIDAVDNVESIRNLAKNPLLLSMICFVHYNKALPKERLSLYEDCSRLLLDQWDIEKGLPQDDIPLNLQRKEILMEEIAFSLHSGKTNVGNSTKEATREEIIYLIRELLKKYDLDPNQSETIFQKLINRTGLLVAIEHYKDSYSFSHLTFQEFYTAKFLHRNNIDIFSTIDPAKLGEHNSSTWWREVIVLYSGMKKQPSEIIHKLYRTNTEDPLNTRIQIATQCLIEAIEPPPDKIRNEILHELLRIRSHGKLGLSEKNKLSNEGYIYLLNFAMSSEFYLHSLELFVSEYSYCDDIQPVIHKLFSFTNSSDRNIQKCSIKALIDLSNHSQDYSFIDQSKISDFIDIVEADSVLIDLIEYTLSKNEIIEDALEKKLKAVANTNIFGFMLGNKLLHDSTERIIAKKLAELLVSHTFCNLHNFLESSSIQTLQQLFNTRRIKRINYSFNRIIREYILILTNIFLAIASEEKIVFFRKQILEMLSKGDKFQQVCAIYLISDIYSTDGELVEKLLKKVISPSAQVRLAAISVLSKLKLSPVQAKITTERLEKR